MVLQQSKQSSAPSIPPLESGDRLTRAEFERRYEAAPEHFKAELIEGVVYVASPVRIFHGNPQFNLILGWAFIALRSLAQKEPTTRPLDSI